MHYYPLFLDLSHFRALIVGLGEVGQRKLEFLIPARPALITLVEPLAPTPLAQHLLSQARAQGLSVQLHHEFQLSLLDTSDLVFACASDHSLNAKIALACKERHILCNCADKPELGSFHLPAVARVDELCLALSTGRASPALAKRWKQELQQWLTPRARLAKLLGKLRPLVLALGQDSNTNRELFRALANATDLEQALAQGDRTAATQILQRLLPTTLCPHIADLLEEIVQ